MHIRKKQNPNNLRVKLFDIMNNRTSEEAFPYLTPSGLLNVTKFLEDNNQCDTNDGPILCRFPEYSYNTLTKFSKLYAQNVAFSDMDCSNSGCYFTDSNLVNSHFDSIELKSIVFSVNNLTQSSFRNTKAEYIVFTKSALIDSRFDFSEFQTGFFLDNELTQASFLKAQLQGIYFGSSHLANTNFFNSTIFDSSFDNNIGNNISFRYAKLAGTNFQSNRFTNVDFSKSSLIPDERFYPKKNVLFNGLNVIQHVNFNYANLEGVTLATDFNGSTFCNAYFKNCILKGNFANSNFNNSTFVFVFDDINYYLSERANFNHASFCDTTLINGNQVIKKPHDIAKTFRETGANIKDASFCDNDGNDYDSSSSKGFIPVIAIGSVVIAFFAFLAILAIGYIIFRKQIHEYANQMAEKRRQEKLSAKENAEIEEKVAEFLNLQAKHYDALNDDVGLPNELIQQILSYSFSEQVIQQTVRSSDHRNDEIDENNDEESLSFKTDNKDETQQKIINRAFNALEEQRHGKLVLSSQKGLLPSLSLFNTSSQRTTPVSQQHKRCQLY